MTFDQFIKIVKACKGDLNKIHISDVIKALNDVEMKLNSKLEFAHFVTQCAFETQNFTKFEENLYYSTPSRLVAVWPSIFKSRYNPELYIKNPEKLANVVYANKLGNGNPASGDGYKFIGRGAFHLTGKNNYLQCSMDLYGDERLVDKPYLVTGYNLAFYSALWFWNKNNCGKVCQEDTTEKVTRKITGCKLTVKERDNLFKKIKKILI